MQGKKKYFKRGDLAEIERKEYEEKHNIKKVVEEEKPSTSASETESLNAIGLDEDKLPMTLSRQEVGFFGGSSISFLE